MQTIQINNPEIEQFISSQYGNDTQSMLRDFVAFVKSSQDVDCPAISKAEARRRVALAVKEVKEGKATLVNQKEYDDEMNGFMKHL